MLKQRLEYLPETRCCLASIRQRDRWGRKPSQNSATESSVSAFPRNAHATLKGARLLRSFSVPNRAARAPVCSVRALLP